MSTSTAQDRTQRVIAPTTRGAAGRPLVLRWVAALASWRVWAVSAVLYAAYAYAFFGTTAPFAIPRVAALCGQKPLDMRLTSSAADVNGFLAACGSTGRDAYRAMQLADLAYPLVFAAFLASSLALVLTLLAPHRPRLLALAALPFLASGFDYAENAMAWRALAAFPQAIATDRLLGVASAAKTVTSWLAGGALIVGTVALLLATVVRWSMRRRHPGSTSRDGLAT